MSVPQAQITAKIKLTQVNALDVASAKFEPLINAVANFSNGTGADQVNQVFTDTRTLSASATENLDLAGSLADAFGNTIALTKLKAILITAASGNTNDVQVTRPASNGVPLFLAAGDGLPVKPDGFFLWVAPDAAGVTVTASTGDLLTITNSAGGSSVTYTVVIIGSE